MFFLMLLAKDYLNRPIFHGAIQKIKVARFLWTIVFIMIVYWYGIIV